MNVDVGLLVAGKYELRRLIGEGGMGQVWLARHVTLEQFVALKLLVPEDDTVESAKVALRRFQIEAQVAAELSRKSKNIVRVHDLGEVDGVAYLAMEPLQGQPLDAAIDEAGRLEPGRVSAIVEQIARALSVAHAEGVTHRDLKPGNVFLSRDETGALLVKVLDFGIARLSRRVSPAAPASKVASPPTKLTLRGMVLGSADYMSPEQALAQEVDVRADVWSLAVLAFEALTGARPFSGATADETLQRICSGRAMRLSELLPSASRGLEAVFERAFARSIDDRFQSANDFAVALMAAAPPALAQSSLSTTLQPTISSGPEPRARRRVWMFAAAAGVALFAVVGLVMLPKSAAHTQPTQTIAPTAIVTHEPSPSAPAAPASSAPVQLDQTATAPRASASARVAPVRSAAPSASVSAAPRASDPHVDKSAIF